MLHQTRIALAGLLAAAFLAGPAQADSLTDSLKKGTADVKSAGPLAFGPEGILFMGDPKGAAIFALDTGDNPKDAVRGPVKIEGIDTKIASLLGTEAKDIVVHDLVVNPASGNVYLSIARGRGPKAPPVLLRVARTRAEKGEDPPIEEVSLKNIKFSRVQLPNPAEGSKRQESITKIAYVKGKVLLAGLSNEEFSSTFRSVAFPFKKAEKGAGVKIFHGSHGGFETKSPVRTFAPYDIKGKTYLLAAYTCTPLVKFPLSELKPGNKIEGITIAELGNHNRPLEMIVYHKGGKDYILMANNKRGLMKISTDNIDKIEAITEKIDDKAGLSYKTVEGLKGVIQLDLLDKEHVLLLIRTAKGALDLKSIELP